MKGTYVLVIELKKSSRIRVGKLGIIDFPKGYYCYVGSALGKNISLENRIKRHKKLNKEKSGKLKWHIDYFLVNPNTSIIQTINLESDRKMECEISEKIRKITINAIQGFGSSDCNCESHFHYFKERDFYLIKSQISLFEFC